MRGGPVVADATAKEPAKKPLRQRLLPPRRCGLPDRRGLRIRIENPVAQIGRSWLDSAPVLSPDPHIP